MSKSVEFEIVLKNGQLKAAAKDSEQAIRNVGSAIGRTSAEMSEGWSSAGEQIEFQKKIIAELEQEVAKLEKVLRNATPGSQWVDAVNELNDVKRELNGEKQALTDMETVVEQTEQKHVSLRSQLRAVREELVAMEMAGERGTEAYRELQERAGALQDAMSDATAQIQVMAHDQRGLQGIISGLSGVSGAFSAASGAMALFGTENENLERIMLRVQSLMAITVGLKEVEEALNKDSAFRLVTLNGLKEWWSNVVAKATVSETAETAAVVANTAATEANAAATATNTTSTVAHAAAATANAAATSASGAAALGAAGAFKVLGTAIKSIPVIGWILAAISAAITAVTLVLKKLKSEEKQQQDQMKKMHKQWSDFNKAVSEKALSSVSSIENLSDKYKRLGDNMSARKKFISDNAEEFRKLGLNVKSVADAENLLINNKDKFMQAQIAKATADVYAERIKELMKQNMSLLGVDIGDDNPKLFPGMKDDGKGFKPMSTDKSSANPIQVAAAREMWSEIRMLQDEAYRQEQKSMELMRATGVQFADNARQGAESINDTIETTPKVDLIGYEANLKKLQEERDKRVSEIKAKIGTNIEFNGEDVIIDSKAIEQEIAQVNSKYQKEADELAEKYGVNVNLNVDGHLVGYEANLGKLKEQLGKRLKEIQNLLNKTVSIDGVDVRYDADAIAQEMKIAADEFNKDSAELAKKYGVSETVKVTLTMGVDDNSYRDQLQDALQDMASKLPDSTDIPVDVVFTTNVDDSVFNELLKQYADYGQRVKAINEKYDAQMKAAGGNEAIMDAIGKERDKEIARLTADTVLAGDAFSMLSDSAEKAGENVRKLLEGRLRRLIDYVKEHKGDASAATEDAANSMGVGVEALQMMLANGESLGIMEQHLDSIGRHNAFKDLAKGIEQLREAQRKCRTDGGPIDENMVAKAKDAIAESVKEIGNALETTISEMSASVREIGEYLGNDDMLKAADMMDDVLGNIKAAEDGAQAWGGWWGAIIGGLTDLIPKMVKWLKPFERIDAQIEETYSNIEEHQRRMDNPRFYDWIRNFDSSDTRDRLEVIADRLVEIKENADAAGDSWVDGFSQLTANGFDNTQAYLQGVRELLSLAMTGEYVGRSVYESFSIYCNNMIDDIADLTNEYQTEMDKAGDNTTGKHYEKAQELAKKIEELTTEYAQNVAAFIEEVFGGSATDIASQLGDALIDAFAAGENAANAWGDTVDDIVRNMTRNLIKQKLIEGPIQEMMDEYEREYASINFRGTDGGLTWWLEQIPEIINRYNDIGERAEAGLESLPDYIKEFFTGSGSDSLSGSIKGITSEQAGMLAGQMNAMRTAQAAQTALLTDQLEALNDIEHNTRYVRDIYNFLRQNNVGANSNLNRAYGQN